MDDNDNNHNNNNNKFPDIIEIQKAIQDRFIEWIRTKWGYLFIDYTEFCNVWFQLLIRSIVEPKLNKLELDVDELDNTESQTQIIREVAGQVISYFFEILSDWYSKDDIDFSKFKSWLYQTKNTIKFTSEELIILTNDISSNSNKPNKKRRIVRDNEPEEDENDNFEDDDDDKNADIIQHIVNSEFPTYQFVHIGVKHIMDKLQKAVYYLPEWYKQHENKILTSHINHIITVFGSSQFELLDSEVCELEDHFETLTKESIGIDEINMDDNNNNNNNNNNNADNNGDHGNDEMQLYIKEQQAENKHNSKVDRADRYKNSSKLKLLQQRVNEYFPKPIDRLIKSGNRKVMDMFIKSSRRPNKYTNSNAKGSKANDFRAFCDPNYRKYESGSLSRLTKVEMELENAFPGCLTHTNVSEDKLKQTLKIFKNKKQTSNTDKKSINSLYLNKFRPASKKQNKCKGKRKK
jgi:hypothetical protein